MTNTTITELSDTEIDQVNGGILVALAILSFYGAAFAWGYMAGKNYALHMNRR